MMRRKFRQQQGFTLIEMLIAMTIFVIFTGILINSYTSIVQSQRDANDYRQMYAESRKIFDTLVQEFRDGMVDYGNDEYACKGGFVGGVDSLHLISKDGVQKSLIYFNEEDGAVKIKKGLEEEFTLNSEEVKVVDFRMYVYPSVDPYDHQYVQIDAYQFQPMVTIFASFEKEKHSGEPYHVDFQTSISSRIYNQVTPTIKCP